MLNETGSLRSVQQNEQGINKCGIFLLECGFLVGTNSKMNDIIIDINNNSSNSIQFHSEVQL